MPSAPSILPPTGAWSTQGHGVSRSSEVVPPTPIPPTTLKRHSSPSSSLAAAHAPHPPLAMQHVVVGRRRGQEQDELAEQEPHHYQDSYPQTRQQPPTSSSSSSSSSSPHRPRREQVPSVHHPTAPMPANVGQEGGPHHRQDDAAVLTAETRWVGGLIQLLQRGKEVVPRFLLQDREGWVPAGEGEETKELGHSVGAPGNGEEERRGGKAQPPTDGAGGEEEEEKEVAGEPEGVGKGKEVPGTGQGRGQVPVPQDDPGVGGGGEADGDQVLVEEGGRGGALAGRVEERSKGFPNQAGQEEGEPTGEVEERGVVRGKAGVGGLPAGSPEGVEEGGEEGGVGLHEEAEAGRAELDEQNIRTFFCFGLGLGFFWGGGGGLSGLVGWWVGARDAALPRRASAMRVWSSELPTPAVPSRKMSACAPAIKRRSTLLLLLLVGSCGVVEEDEEEEEEEGRPGVVEASLLSEPPSRLRRRTAASSSSWSVTCCCCCCCCCWWWSRGWWWCGGAGAVGRGGAMTMLKRGWGRVGDGRGGRCGVLPAGLVVRARSMNLCAWAGA